MNLDVETFLTAHLDGEVDPEQRLGVESALVSDPRLAEDLRTLTAVRDLVAGLSRQAHGPDVSAAVVARIERRRVSRPFGLGLVLTPAPASWAARAVALVSAAAALIAAATVGLPRANVGPVVVRHGRDLEPRRPVPTPVNPSPVGPAADFVQIADAARETAPGLDDRERERDQEQQRIRRLLDSPTIRKVLFVTDIVGGRADRQVGELLERTPRRTATFGRITVTQGVVIDPAHPGEATVFAAVMDDEELKAFQGELNKSFPRAVEESGPRPELVTQLADIGQVAILHGTIVADVLLPNERPSRALRTEPRMGPDMKARLLVDDTMVGSLSDPSTFDLPDPPPTERAGPTPEQERSGPHPSNRPGARVVDAPAAVPGIDERQTLRRDRPPASVVLVWVATAHRKNGRGLR
jgi:hypothetical protein